jgi:hypothetical protein
MCTMFYFAAKLLPNKTYELRNACKLLDFTKCPVATSMEHKLKNVYILKNKY